MNAFLEYFTIIFGAIFINNFVLSKFLGICPFLGVSKKTNTALGMGFAVIFVMGISSIITFLVNKYVLVNLNLEFLRTISFILIIASLVQIVEMVIKKVSPALYNALGVYLPLITTNCAVLGAALINIKPEFNYSLLQAFLNGVFSGVGFTLAIFILAGIREKLETVDIPKPFQGFPITLIAASIMSMAFVAFAGITFIKG